MRKIKKGSADIVATDPPYVKEVWEEAYTTLAQGALDILKPGGYLITYSGHQNLPSVMNILGEKLEYFWTVAQLNTGCTAMVFSRGVMAGWKPILIYQKPPVSPLKKGFMDVISGRRSKEFHPWGQDIHEALHLLSRFTEPGYLVVDPFLGGGTFPLAAKLLGLRYIGFELNPDTFKVASRRMEQTALDLSSFNLQEDP